MIRLLTLVLALSGVAWGAPGKTVGSQYTEERRAKNGSGRNSSESQNKAHLSEEERQMDAADGQIMGIRNLYERFNNRVRVPGFMSAARLPQLAKIVGPQSLSSSMRMGDTIYIRWSGGPPPRVGDRYATFTPAVVLQNLADPSDFEIFLPAPPGVSLPKERRMAGYLYESTGRIRLTKISGGLVHAMIEQLSGQVMLGDELMPVLPLLENIKPITGGIHLSAAVICGSPHDRLSTTKRSVIYINRGSRDGIQVGRVFQSIEAVQLNEMVRGGAPEISNGEAMVIHTTDSYSTAIITRQFDVIRMGSLLRTKQEGNPIEQSGPFGGYASTAKHEERDATEIPKVDARTENLDESLPEPRKKPTEAPLSELDQMEKDLRLKDLTAAEKTRLDKLSKQDKLGYTKPDEVEESSENPDAPTVENSFKDGKKVPKKDKKDKKKAKNDEEELNLLMMQN